MTLPCISSVATFWPAVRSLLVMITFAPDAASTLTVSLPMPAVTHVSIKFAAKTDWLIRQGLLSKMDLSVGRSGGFSQGCAT